MTRLSSRLLTSLPGRLPRLIALLTTLTGVMDVLSALTPSLRPRLNYLVEVVPLPLAHAATGLTVVIGILLVLLGHSLARRKRRAYVLTLALLAASALIHLLKGLDIEEAVVSIIALVLLLCYRSRFTASADPRSRRSVPLSFAILLVLSLALGLAVTYLRHALPAPFPLRVEHVFLGLVGVSGPLSFHSPRAAGAVEDILLSLGALTLFLPLYLLLRPARPLPAPTTEEQDTLRTLLARFPDDSLGYFALRQDKAVVFSPSKKAAVTYRVLSGVALASGDPLGDPEAWPGAIAAFLEMCTEHAWIPAVLGCSEPGGTAWAKKGLTALEIGDEAVVETETFTLEGRPMRTVRQSHTRMLRQGVTPSFARIKDLTPERRAELTRLAEEWRHGEVERGFSMALGRFLSAEDPDSLVVTAEKDGSPIALLSFVPWGKDGLSLDLMRRSSEADSAVNEFLIASLLLERSLGVERVSLNFAVFRSTLARGERLGAGPITRLWCALLLFASRFVQIESLYRFNAKFRPSWEPRFVCYPQASSLPRILLAALEAEAFLTRPSLGRRA